MTVLLLLLVPLTLCTALLVPTSEAQAVGEAANGEELLRRGVDWVGESFSVESWLPDGRAGRADGVEGRRRKRIKLNKYLFPLIVGFLLIKSVILPLALKALAILSGKAVVLSLMSLILAAIVGLKSVAGGSPAQSKIDLVNLPVHKYRRKDVLVPEVDPAEEEQPYRYYPERRRR